MSRPEARQVFKHTIDALPDRQDVLARICKQNGYSNDPDGWTQLIDDHADCEPADSTGSYELTPLWRSLVFDVSLAMSDLLIQRGNGQLKWKFYFGSKNSFAYHHPVIVGFRQAAKGYHIEMSLPLSNMARKAACGEPMRHLGDYLDYLATDI